MDVPPPPVKPDLDSKPRPSWMTIPLVVLFGLAMAAILTFLTLGYFGPVLALGFGIFFIIGLQYLVWGWWFERVYRTPEAIARAEREDAGPAPSVPPPNMTPSRDQTWSR